MNKLEYFNLFFDWLLCKVLNVNKLKINVRKKILLFKNEIKKNSQK